MTVAPRAPIDPALSPAGGRAARRRGLRHGDARVHRGRAPRSRRRPGCCGTAIAVPNTRADAPRRSAAAAQAPGGDAGLQVRAALRQRVSPALSLSGAGRVLDRARVAGAGQTDITNALLPLRVMCFQWCNRLGSFSALPPTARVQRT